MNDGLTDLDAVPTERVDDSVIGFATNNVDTRFWLYRDVLQNCAGSLRDYLKLSPVVRGCLGWRAAKRVRAALATPPHPPG